jgi:hypothetical protein
MRTHFRTGPAWRTNLAALVPIPNPSPVPDLPREQIMMLLDVRGAAADSLFAKVIERLRREGGRKPDRSDQIKLCEAGYIQYRGARDWSCYVITPAGLEIARRIARKLARKLGLHHVEVSHPGRRSNAGPTASCTCGWNTIGPKSAAGRVAADGERHLEAVKAGTWKAPRAVEQVLAETFGAAAAG